jgi:hypothetical protein
MPVDSVHQLFDEGVFEVQLPKLACVEALEVVDNEHIGSAFSGHLRQFFVDPLRTSQRMLYAGPRRVECTRLVVLIKSVEQI